MPDYILPAQRYRSLILMGFVHAKFGSVANALLVFHSKWKCGIIHQGLICSDILKQRVAGNKPDKNIL